MEKELTERTIEAFVNLFEYSKIDAELKRKNITFSPRFMSVDILLSNPLELDKALSIDESLALALGVDSIIARRHSYFVRYDISLPKKLWKEYTFSDCKEIGQIGVGSGSLPILYDYHEPSTLIAGSSGSGKSITLRTILLSVCKQLTPRQIQIGLIDTHKSIEEFNQSAHFLFAPATNQDDVENLIGYFEEQLQIRKSLGEQKVKDDKMPLLLLAIDEASDLVVLGNKDNPNKENIVRVQQLIKEGRKFGMRTIISTQKPNESDLPGIFGLITNRYVGLVANASMSNLLSGQSQLNAHKLTGNGDFYFTKGNSVHRFVVAHPKESDYHFLPKATLFPVDYRVKKTLSSEIVKGLKPEIIADFLTNKDGLYDTKTIRKYKTISQNILAKVEENGYLLIKKD